jgi:hypothetical protein
VRDRHRPEKVTERRFELTLPHHGSAVGHARHRLSTELT